MNDNKHKIRQFLLKHVKKKNFEDDDHIFEKGYVSSLLAMELVVFVENEFSIKIGNEDLQLDNFKSVTAIDQLVGRKIKKRAT
jgi:acyl carrier protein